MARIFPDTPVGACSPEALRLFRLLKRLPESEYDVWQRLSIWKESGPDFWVMRQDQSALLLKVSSMTLSDVRAIIQPDLFGSDPRRAPIWSTERAELEQFIERVMADSDEASSALSQIPAIIVCPNLANADLASVVPSDMQHGVGWTGKDILTADTFGTWIYQHLGPPLSENHKQALRKAFTPEVIIPASFTVRQPINRNTKSRLTKYLLDYAQEWVLKNDLELSGEARAAAEDVNIKLLNGVAGSGKSLIVVFRAYLLRRLFPGKSILVLTHNRPLIRDLEARHLRLDPSDHGLEWRTFQSWCYHHWPRGIVWKDPIGQKAREKVILRAWRKHLADTAVTEHMLQDEIDWFKDRVLFGRAEYLGVDRTGRGFALGETMRQRVYDAMTTYHRELQAKGEVDWSDVPRHVWNFINEGRIPTALYDAVLVDEAQFFAPLWFEIIKKILKPGVGHLFLAADPTQGFLRRRQSWIASGLEVRGRSYRLEKSYRTTREILDFATLLYRTRLPNDDDDIVAPDLLDMPSGTYPVIIPLTSKQDEITYVVNEIKDLANAGVRLADILLVHTDWLGRDRLLKRLKTEFGPNAAVDPGETKAAEDAIRVCTLNSATGLESPIVFLSGVHMLYEEEQSLRLADSERAELIRDNTRKLYMAITRASQRLVLTYVGELPTGLQQMMH